jgi:nitrogen fixation NifU-like protein
MAYSDKVVDHFQHPRNVGSFGTSTDVAKRTDVGVGIVGAPECGDVMQLHIKVNEQGVIEDAKFKCFGCGSAKGKSVDEALTIKNTQIVEELSLPPVKIHCSVLAEDSIRAAIADYRKKNGMVADSATHAAAH